MHLNLYLLFVVSWFLHLGARVPALGALRFDFLLLVGLSYLAYARLSKDQSAPTATDKTLRHLIIYVLLTIPFAEWPGSVIKIGIPNLMKVLGFYYFTIAFVRNRDDLLKFIVVFAACQAIRVMEPLLMHFTSGYWGDKATMEGGGDQEMLNRLAGAPSDVVNPNGLAFVICSVLPFLYFLAPLSWKGRIAAAGLIPPCLLALILTGSRSGMVGAAVIYMGIVYKSKSKFLLVAIAALTVVVGFARLSPDMQDRYLSTIGLGHKNAATAHGRFTGIQHNLKLAMRRPIFGHGLGSSKEVEANFGGYAQPAHNLYAETAQELGFVGLIFLIRFIASIFSGFSSSRFVMRASSDHDVILSKIIDALQVWLAMNIIFSFATYGLSGYSWYMFAGCSVVIQRLVVASRSRDMVPIGSDAKKPYAAAGRNPGASASRAWH